ncbi:MAG TPA: tRNA (guanosine(37)-N1)-methyltransferase TrmD [candidate division Zixibacteria bacterium]|nr:tRNA (guanosine(37)-N1)-methyltransferase TrmD [candidate division Zixibacteria bacterium]
MKFEVVTLFPEYFSLSLKQSLIGKAVEKKLFDIEIVNPREFATDKHRTVDDTPFGGGGGMVMKIEPLDRCLRSLGFEPGKEQKGHRLVLTSAAGARFDQDMAIEYSLAEGVTIICGHYLGIDERLVQMYEPDEVSIGDYILTGGEPAALVMIDAIARLIPKVLGNFESALNDSYMDQIVGTPSYTRPAEYEGLAVPPELMGGNHEVIKRFRRLEAIRKCLSNRPDLLRSAELTDEEKDFVKEIDEDFHFE